MFKQLEYSEILFKIHSEILVDVYTTKVQLVMSLHTAEGQFYVPIVSYPKLLIIFYKLLKFGRCAHDESLIDNESPYR